MRHICFLTVLCVLLPAAAFAHAPAALVVTSRTDTSVSLDWTQNPYDHAYDGYYIRVDGGPRVHYPGSSGTVSGLEPGTTYRFCVTVNYTSSSEPDESPQSCIDASTTGTPPSSSEPDFGSALWRPYAASSPFNKPVGSSPTVSANGANIVKHILAGSSSTNGPGAIVLDEPRGETSHARYHADGDDPRYRVVFNQSWCTNGEGDTIRIPLGATPAGGWNRTDWSGWDGHMSVTQPRNAITGQVVEYDFYQGRSITNGSPGTITADCGGKEDAEQGDGSGTGSTVANFALMAGQVKASELLSSEPIDHALFMSVPCSNGTRVAWLQTSGSGAKCSTDVQNAPPLGQRFYLPYTDSEIAALPAKARPWVRALRDYGAYFGDTGGPADFGLHAAIEASYTYASFGLPNPINTWAQQVGLPRNSAGRYVLRISSPDTPIDWTRLKAIEP